jgi:hypothetical protein
MRKRITKQDTRSVVLRIKTGWSWKISLSGDDIEDAAFPMNQRATR